MIFSPVLPRLVPEMTTGASQPGSRAEFASTAKATRVFAMADVLSHLRGRLELLDSYRDCSDSGTHDSSRCNRSDGHGAGSA